MKNLITKEIQTISSREVAEMMEVRHDNLMNKIERHTTILEKVNDLKIKVVDLWQLSSYKDAKGETRKEYQVTKKGCEFLAHKTTGEKGDLFTIRYMNKFEEMEQYIKEQNTPSYMIEDPVKRAERWIEEYKEKQLLEESNEKLNKEVVHKEDVIIGLVEDIDLATKRQRIKQIINHNANGRYGERYKLLYTEFQDKYHIDLKRRMSNLEYKTVTTNKHNQEVKVTSKIKTNKMEYIDKVLCMTAELYEVACKVFENDIKELMKEWESVIV